MSTRMEMGVGFSLENEEAQDWRLGDGAEAIFPDLGSKALVEGLRLPWRVAPGISLEI